MSQRQRPLLEIGTDKVDTDLEAQADGTLTEIRFAEERRYRWGRSSR
jgi:pyruvate/2-oxoglutarate dehydrogenase complex dihydrolipoamide acyltransferase (E2) component